MKIDEGGEYDELAVPIEFECPIRIDELNDAIVCRNGRVLGLYNYTSVTSDRVQSKRRAEFLCKLANGEIMMLGGKVYRRFSTVQKDGQIIAGYVPVVEVVDLIEGNGHIGSEGGVVGVLNKVVDMVKRGGRKKKPDEYYIGIVDYVKEHGVKEASKKYSFGKQYIETLVKKWDRR